MKKSWIILTSVLMMALVLLFASCTGDTLPQDTTAPTDVQTNPSETTPAETTGEDVTTDQEATTIGSDIPVTYDVTFLKNDGSMLKRRQVLHGEAAVAPDAPEIEGYTFIGWDTDFSNVTENLIVRPIYQKIKGPDPATQDITVTFEANLAQYAGTPNDTLEMSATDIAEYFDQVVKPLGTTYLTNGYYATGGFGSMTREADGRWAYTVHIVDVNANIAGTCDPAMVARCYNAAQIGLYEEIWGMYEYDGDSSAEAGSYEHGGATGIHLSFHQGKIILYVKAFDDSNPDLYSKGVRNYTFQLATSAKGKTVTLADDGHNVYVYIDGALSATVALSGSVEYDDVFCMGGYFAETAVVTLADGTSTTVPNTLVADTAAAQFGIAWRHGTVLYNTTKVQGFTTYDPKDDLPGTGNDDPAGGQPIVPDISKDPENYDQISSISLNVTMGMCQFVDITQGSWQTFTTDRPVAGISFWASTSGTAAISIYKIEDGSTPEAAMSSFPAMQATFSGGKAWFDELLPAGNYVMQFNNFENSPVYEGRIIYHRFYGHSSTSSDFIQLSNGGNPSDNVIALQLLVVKSDAPTPDTPDTPTPDTPTPDTPSADGLINMTITKNTDDYDKIASSDALMWQCEFVDLTPGSWQTFTSDRTIVGMSFWQGCSGTATVLVYKVEDGSTPQEAIKGTPVIQGKLTGGNVWFDKGLPAGDYVMVFDNMENCATYNGTPYLRFYGHSSRTSNFIICSRGDGIQANVVVVEILVTKE